MRALLDPQVIDCKKALSSNYPDFEDAIMIETAARAEDDCIVTRNLEDYKGPSVPVYSPSAFVKMLFSGGQAE